MNLSIFETIMIALLLLIWLYYAAKFITAAIVNTIKRSKSNGKTD